VLIFCVSNWPPSTIYKSTFSSENRFEVQQRYTRKLFKMEVLKLNGLKFLTLVLLFLMMNGCESNQQTDVCGQKSKLQRFNLVREHLCKNVESEGDVSSGRMRVGYNNPKSTSFFIERCCANLPNCTLAILMNLESQICTGDTKSKWSFYRVINQPFVATHLFFHLTCQFWFKLCST